MSSFFSRKRSFLETVVGDDPTIRIVTHDCVDEVNDALPAHIEFLRFVSSCAKDLPLELTNTWDLRGLVVCGKPVDRALALSWLELVYAHNGYCRGPELTTSGVISLNAILPLVTLADALGTKDAVLKSVTTVPMTPKEHSRYRLSRRAWSNRLTSTWTT